MLRNTLTVVLFLCMVVPCSAGWLEDTLKGAAQGVGRRAVNEATTGAYEGAKKGAKDAVNTKGQPSENAPVVDGSGRAGKTAAKQPATEAQTSGSGDATIEEAETVYSKYDFVPGDKVIFFDDFSDTDVGEFPRKWTLSGPKGGNNVAVEVVEYQGKRFLRSSPSEKGQRQHESTQYIRLNQQGDLPEKFTLEFDAVLSQASVANYINHYYVYLLKAGDGFPGQGSNRVPGVIGISGKDNRSLNTNMQLSRADNKVHHVAISVNGTFVKAYVDNQRVINDPDAIKRPLKFVGISMLPGGTLPTDKLMFTNFRLAEGGKNIRSALDTDGKIVTHGILFDTGKDVIKPESLPTLKSILAILNGDPGLNFSIEGHTDNQGNKAINQPLSEKRASAVSAWLADKGIVAERLKIKGLGDTKPIDSNETPEGRANNRRVEFVKF